MTPSDVIRAQLLAARSGIDAALTLLDMQAPPKVEVVPGAPCTHPQEKRQANPVSGDVGQFLCRACMSMVSGKVEPDGA
jgi:hypothetical protein